MSEDEEPIVCEVCGKEAKLLFTLEDSALLACPECALEDTDYDLRNWRPKKDEMQ